MKTIKIDGDAYLRDEIRESLLTLTGVDIRNNDDSFKSTSEIIESVSKSFNQLSPLHQEKVCTILAGRHKSNNMFARLSTVCNSGIQLMMGNELLEKGKFLPPDEYMSKRFDKSDIDLDINADFIETIKNKGELNKMDILQKIKDNAISVIKEYEETSINKINDKYSESKIALLKSTKTKELIDKHKNELRKELCDLRSISSDFEFELTAYERGSYGCHRDITCNSLTEDESEKLIELSKNQSKRIQKIESKCDRLISSLDLCENREQIMDILKANDLVDNNGVIKDFGETNE